MRSLNEYIAVDESREDNLRPTSKKELKELIKRRMKEQGPRCDLKVVIANRAGDIFKEVIYKDVMLIEGLSGFDELNYTSNDHVDLEFELKSDWADDTDA